jgi:hypothetical protein
VEWSSDESERQRKILALWAQRGMAHQTGTDVVSFYFWLQQYRPDLLKPDLHGDAYPDLKALITPVTRGDSAGQRPRVAIHDAR